jgi:uncharacterized Zn finger protein
MDNVSYMMNLLDGYYETKEVGNIIESMDKTYDIRMHPMTLEWECSCPAYKFSRGTKSCKHIKEIQNNSK